MKVGKIGLSIVCVLAMQTGFAVSIWQGLGSTWSNPSNWTGGVPSGTGTLVTLGSMGTVAPTDNDISPGPPSPGFTVSTLLVDVTNPSTPSPYDINTAATYPIVMDTNSTIHFEGAASPNTITLSNVDLGPLTSSTVLVESNTNVTPTWTVLTGVANLNITGPNPILISGANSGYGGLGTTVTLSMSTGPGILFIDNDASLGASGTVLVGNVGELGIQPSTTLSLPYNTTLDSGGITFNANNNTLTLTGEITGVGTLTSAGGTGMLVLTGDNGYTGGTTVSSGSIGVGSNTALGTGTLTMDPGTVTIQAEASVSLANAISIAPAGDIIDTNGFNLTLSGAVTGGAVTQVGSGTLTFTGISSVPITVNAGTLSGNGTVGALTNNATVQPTSLEILTVDGTYTQASGGTLSVDLNALGQSSLLLIGGTAALDGTLDLNFLPGTYFAGTTYTVLEASDGLGGSTFSLIHDSPAFYSYAYTANGVVITITENNLFPTLSGKFNVRQVAAYLNSLTYTIGSSLADNIIVLDALTGDPLNDALDQLHPAIFGAFELVNLNTSTMVSSIFTHRSARGCCPFNVWLEPFGYYMNQDKIGEQVGFEAWDAGAVAGFDFLIDEFVLGVGLGYSYENIHWNKNRGHGNVDSAYFGAYFDWAREGFYIETAAVCGMNWYDATRRIHYSSVSEQAKHMSKGYDFTGHLGFGYDYYEVCDFHFTPFADADYVYLSQDGFTEHGAGSLDLNVSNKRSNMLRSELGLSLSKNFRMCDYCIIPNIWLSCVSEAYLNNKHYEASLVNQPGEFRARSWNKAITLASPGAEVGFLFDNNAALTVTYSAELNSTTATQKGRLRFEYNF